MHWNFWDNHVGHKITTDIHVELVSRFHLSPRDAERMRYLGKQSVHADKQVTKIRVFRSDLLASLDVKTYDDLEQQSNAIMFEGYIEKTGTVYLADRRLPKVLIKQKVSPIKRA